MQSQPRRGTLNDFLNEGYSNPAAGGGPGNVTPMGPYSGQQPGFLNQNVQGMHPMHALSQAVAPMATSVYQGLDAYFNPQPQANAWMQGPPTPGGMFAGPAQQIGQQQLAAQQAAQQLYDFQRTQSYQQPAEQMQQLQPLNLGQESYDQFAAQDAFRFGRPETDPLNVARADQRVSTQQQQIQSLTNASRQQWVAIREDHPSLQGVNLQGHAVRGQNGELLISPQLRQQIVEQWFARHAGPMKGMRPDRFNEQQQQRSLAMEQDPLPVELAVDDNERGEWVDRARREVLGSNERMEQGWQSAPSTLGIPVPIDPARAFVDRAISMPLNAARFVGGVASQTGMLGPGGGEALEGAAARGQQHLESAMPEASPSASGLNPRSANWWATLAAGLVPDVVASFGLGAAAKNLAGQIAARGAQSAQVFMQSAADHYSEARNRGTDIPTALRAGLLVGAQSAGLEQLPISAITLGKGGGLGRRVASGAAAEAVTELGQEEAAIGAEYTFEGLDPFSQENIQRRGTAAIGGALGGGFAGAAFGPGRQQRVPPTNETPRPFEPTPAEGAPPSGVYPTATEAPSAPVGPQDASGRTQRLPADQYQGRLMLPPDFEPEASGLIRQDQPQAPRQQQPEPQRVLDAALATHGQRTGKPAGGRLVQTKDPTLLAVAESAKARGMDVQFYRPDSTDAPPAIYSGTTAFIEDSPEGAHSLMEHEWTHHFEQSDPQGYRRMLDAIRKVGGMPHVETAAAAYAQRQAIPAGKEVQEGVAELWETGFSQLSDPNSRLLGELAKDRGLLRRVARAISNFVARVTGGRLGGKMRLKAEARESLVSTLRLIQKNVEHAITGQGRRQGARDLKQRNIGDAVMAQEGDIPAPDPLRRPDAYNPLAAARRDEVRQAFIDRLIAVARFGPEEAAEYADAIESGDERPRGEMGDHYLQEIARVIEADYAERQQRRTPLDDQSDLDGLAEEQGGPQFAARRERVHIAPDAEAFVEQLYHFSKSPSLQQTGIQRKHAGTAAAGQEREDIKRDARGKVKPESAAVFLYDPTRADKPEPEVRQQTSHRYEVRGSKMRLLNIRHPQMADVVKDMKERFGVTSNAGIRAVMKRELKRTYGFDGIHDPDTGIVNLFRDVEPGEVGSSRDLMQEPLAAARRSRLAEAAREEMIAANTKMLGDEAKARAEADLLDKRIEEKSPSIDYLVESEWPTLTKQLEKQYVLMLRYGQNLEDKSDELTDLHFPEDYYAAARRRETFGGTYYWENPTAEQIRGLQKRALFGELRGLVVGNKVMWWDSAQLTHDQFAEDIGLNPEDYPGTHHAYFDGRRVSTYIPGDMPPPLRAVVNDLSAPEEKPEPMEKPDRPDDQLSFFAARRDPGYTGIGHDSTPITLWWMDAGRWRAEELDQGDGNEGHANRVKGRMWPEVSGRIDHAKKLASISYGDISSTSEAMLRRARNEIRGRYPDYQIFEYGNNGYAEGADVTEEPLAAARRTPELEAARARLYSVYAQLVRGDQRKKHNAAEAYIENLEEQLDKGYDLKKLSAQEREYAEVYLKAQQPGEPIDELREKLRADLEEHARTWGGMGAPAQYAQDRIAELDHLAAKGKTEGTTDLESQYIRAIIESQPETQRASMLDSPKVPLSTLMNQRDITGPERDENGEIDMDWSMVGGNATGGSVRPEVDAAAAPADEITYTRTPLAAARRQTDTPEFGRWFGKSKVVGDGGEPLVVYHGTQSPGFEAFDDTGAGQATGNDGWFGRGFYFTDQPRVADRYAKRGGTYPAYLSLQNPLVVDSPFSAPGRAALAESLSGMKGVTEREARTLRLQAEEGGSVADMMWAFGPPLKSGRRLREILLDNGYDGVVVDGPAERGSGLREFVAFRPEQIKSAIGNSGGFDAGNPSILAAARRPLRELSTAELRDQPLNAEQTMFGPKPKAPGTSSVAEVATLLQKRTRQIAGKARGDADKIKRAIAAGIPETEYQLEQPDSGRDWYKGDIAKMEKLLTSKLHPELKKPEKMTLFKAILAISSSGNNPYVNFKMADAIYSRWKSEGSIPVLQESGKNWPGNAPYASAFARLEELVRRHGEKGAAQWLLAKHTVADLNALSDSLGLGKNVSGDRTDLAYGAEIFGPKLGVFFLNQHGVQEKITKDKWWSRTWNRWMGTLIEGEQIQDVPRSPSERQVMDVAAADLAERMGMDPADVQATLWYYEQQLYKAHGAPSESGSYSKAAERILAGDRYVGARASEAGRGTEEGGEAALFGQAAAADDAGRGLGRQEALAAARRKYPVDERSQIPFEWHRHDWLKKQVLRELARSRSGGQRKPWHEHWLSNLEHGYHEASTDLQRQYMDSYIESLGIESEPDWRPTESMPEDYYAAARRPQQQQQSLPSKIANQINGARLIQLGFDAGAVMRQAGIGVQKSIFHPGRVMRAAKQAWSGMTQEKVNEQLRNINRRPNAKLYEEAGLELEEVGTSDLAKRAEEAQTTWADKIPIASHLNNAQTAFKNSMKADEFDAMWEGLGDQYGIDPEQKQVRAQAIAKYINVAYGRGGGQKMRDAAPVLNTLLLAPRWVLSRFEYAIGTPLYGGDAKTRLAIAREYAKHAVGLGVLYALGMAAGGELERDPDTSIGTLKFGNRRVDPTAGLAQVATLVTRVLRGMKETAKEQKQSRDVGRDIQNFARYKLAPIPGAAYSLATGKGADFKPTGPMREALRMVTPIIARDVYDALKDEHSLPEDIAWLLLSFLGMNSRVMEPRASSGSGPKGPSGPKKPAKPKGPR
jgi:hypothetical protein